jgi:hypothetical protein
MENMETIETISDYNILYSIFKNYNMTDLLNLCEKNKLSIYGSRESIVDRLSLYYSEGHRRKSISTRIKECYKSFINNIFNINGYSEI